jgi:mRNA cleavage and polyadenylation factor CLP1 P-loop
VGPTNAGKSSLTRLLLNYACRERVNDEPNAERMQPLFVDLDIGGSFLLPCTGPSPTRGGIEVGLDLRLGVGQQASSRSDVQLYRTAGKLQMYGCVGQLASGRSDVPLYRTAGKLQMYGCVGQLASGRCMAV